MQIITVTNLKGGSAKTTSATHLAHAFAAQGSAVFLVDADPQGSTLRWAEQAEWAIPTVALPAKNIHTRIAGIAPAGTDVVVIDTPPLEDNGGIVTSAIRAADVVIVTMAPTMIEYDRLEPVFNAIDDVEPLRDSPVIAAVLLNRTVTNANSTPMFRDLIEADGHHVISTTIPRRETYAQAFAAPITDLGKYADVAREIQTLGATK